MIPEEKIGEYEREMENNFCCKELKDLINTDITPKDFKILLKFESLLFGESKPVFFNVVKLFSYENLDYPSLDSKFNIYCKIFLA